MKIKTSELTGAALDWAVAKCEAKRVGATLNLQKFLSGWEIEQFAFSTDWSQGGPIIERERMSVTSQTNGHSWAAKQAHNYSYGPTPLIAAMRCYVAFKLGNEVDVPDELFAEPSS